MKLFEPLREWMKRKSSLFWGIFSCGYCFGHCEPLDKIFNKGKVWELRGSNTTVRGKIALIESGAKQIRGTCDLIDVIPGVSIEKLINNQDKHLAESIECVFSRYKVVYVWVISKWCFVLYVL